MYCLCMRMSYCIKRFLHFMWQRSFIYRPGFWVLHRPTFAESKLLIHLHTANLWVSHLLFFFHHFPHQNSCFIFQPKPFINGSFFIPILPSLSTSLHKQKTLFFGGPTTPYKHSYHPFFSQPNVSQYSH